MLSLVIAPTGCGDRVTETREDSDGKEQVELLLNWYPEVEHGGYYAALVHGYFADEGLDVTIVPGGPNAPVFERVASGKQTFGIENADRILFARAADADVVGVFAPLQTSPRCIVVHEASGIQRLDQLINVTLAMSSAAPWAKYLQKRLPLEGVRIVPNPGNLSLFLRDEQFAQQGYVFSEPLVARKEGATPRALLVSEIGYNPYTSVLVGRGALLKDRPELARKIVRASVRGWKKYLEDPTETNRLIHEKNPEMSLEVLTEGLAEMRPLCGLGPMSLNRWSTLAEQLAEIEALTSGPSASGQNPAAAFTNEFLPDSEVGKE